MPINSKSPCVSSPSRPLEQTWARKSAKLLAAFALLATTAGTAWATDYNIFGANNYGTWSDKGDGKTCTFVDATDQASFTITVTGTTRNIPTDKEIRLYGSKELTISSSNSVMTKIVLTSSQTKKISLSEGWTSTTVTNTSITLTNTSGANSVTIKNSESAQIKIQGITITAALASTDLGEIMYGDEVANGQNVTATAGDVFTFTADNAESMSIKVGTETDPSITGTNSVSWTATTPIADNTTYNLTISATKGTETKTATFTVVVKMAPLCTMPPVFTPGVGTITKGSTVTITCENAKQIKYWISENADDAEADAQTVDAPATVTIDQNCWLHACGINADGIAGETSAVQYTVTEPTFAEFDFTNAESINAAEGSEGIEANNLQTNESKNNLDGKSLSKNGITLSFAQANNKNNKPRWWQKTANQGGGTELRIYTDNTLTVSAENGKKLSKITMDGTVAMTASAGTISNGVWTPSASVQTMARAEGDITSVVLTPTSTCNISSIAVEYANTTPTGIDGIEAEDGEAVYFNLQGVRVQNPEKGIFIRVQNGKAVKIAK